MDMGRPAPSKIHRHSEPARELVPRSSASGSALPDVIGEAFPNSRIETRRALLVAAGVRRFGVGHTILRQGDDGSLALVLDGHVAVRRTTDDGRQLIVRIVRRGGLLSLLPLAARPASGDAVALTPTPAAVWHAQDIRSLAMADSGLAVDILDEVLLTYEEVVKRLDSLLHQKALRRVARVLATHADLFFAEPPVLSRSNLPTLLGTSREMTGRVLRVLEFRRVIARVGRDRLRLLDPDGLAAAAESEGERARAARGTSSSPVAFEQ
jgi:CRP-like cAMP-binding protein